MAGLNYQTTISLAAKVASSFKSTFAGATAGISKLREETEKLTRAEKATESFAKVSADLATAKARYDATAGALARLTTAELAAGGATKESARWRKAGEAELARTAKDLDRTSQAAGRNAKALHDAGVNTSNLAHEQHRLGEALEAAERKMKRAEAVEHHFGETIAGAKKKLHELGTVEGSAGMLKENVKGLAETGKHLIELTVGAEGAAFALFEVAKSTAEAGGEIEKTSKRIGIGAEALQLLQFAGKASHTDVEELNTGLGKMTVNIGKVIAAKKKAGSGGFSGESGGLQFLPSAATGKASPNDPFKSIGLSAAKLAKLKPEEQLAAISGGIEKLKTHSEKAAAAVAIFGKGGLAMLPLIEKGTEGLEELFAAARASGNILTDETIENAGKFHHAYLQTEQSILGVKNTLGAALLPVATEVLGEISAYVRDNRDEIKAWALGGAKWIKNDAIPAVQKLIPEVKALVTQIAGWVKSGLDAIGGVKNLGAALLALRLAPTGISLAALAVNVGRLAVQYWGATAAAKALAAAQAAGGGGGGAGGAAGTAIAATATMGAKAAAALAAPTIGAAIAAGGLVLTTGLVAAAAAGGLLIGTAIREAFNTDDALANLFGQDVRNDSDHDTNDADKQETERLNQFAANRRRTFNRPNDVGPPEPAGDTNINYNPVINLNGGTASKADLDAAHAKAQAEFEARWERMHKNKKRLASS